MRKVFTAVSQTTLGPTRPLI